MVVDRGSYLTSSDSLLVSLITIVISGHTFSSLLAAKSSFYTAICGKVENFQGSL